MDSIQDLFFQN